mgnify:FL=1
MLTGGKLSRRAIEQVAIARNIYANALGSEIDKLIVVSTAETVTSSTKLCAEENQVDLILRANLAKGLNKSQIYYSEIEVANKSRFSLEKLKRLIKF